MLLIQGPGFNELFRTFARTAFHLEVNDAYHTPEESEPFRKFLAGDVDDFAWHRPWLDLVKATTREGRRIERIRIVSVPHGDYTRWGPDGRSAQHRRRRRYQVADPRSYSRAGHHR